MDIGGGYIISAENAAAWQSAFPDEYAEYVEAGLYNPSTRELRDFPEWMTDGDPNNGPFDFSLNQSHGTHGW